MSNELTMINDDAAFERGQRVAKLFAHSKLVPVHLQGDAHVADCFIALHMASRMNIDPLTVMQNIYFVSGKAGWSASFMVAMANRSGVFKDQISWESTGKGDTLEVTASATLASNGKVVSATASMAMAKAEGWTKNSKYNSMPEHMLRYRAATFLIRLYAPEVMFGIPATEENEDVVASKARDVTPLKAVPYAQLSEDKKDSFSQASNEKYQASIPSSAKTETPHDPETGEILTRTQELLDGDDIPEFSDAAEGYTMTYLNGKTVTFDSPAEFEKAYKSAYVAAQEDKRDALRDANAATIERAKADMAQDAA